MTLASLGRKIIGRIPDPVVRHYLARRRNWFALVLAASLVAINWPILGATHEIPAVALPVLSVTASAPLALLFAGPTAVFVGWAMVVLTGTICGLFPHPSAPIPFPIPMFIVLLVMTLVALAILPPKRVLLVTVVTSLALLIGVESPSTLPAWSENRIGWIFSLVIVAVTISFIRYRISSQRVIIEQAREAEDAQAREAVLAERARIVRELHDVVAHRMSMVVVMSQTAKYRLAAGDEPEIVGPGADAEFAAIADAARQSLDEVRQLLGVLRPTASAAGTTAQTPDLRPAAALNELPELIAAVQAAGVSVGLVNELGADSELVGKDLGASGVALYRIVQESLTNAARHAPGARVDIRLRRRDDHLVVTIINGPAPDGARPETKSGGGHGLIGIAERAAAVGGEATAGPTPDGGFAVTASVRLNR